MTKQAKVMEHFRKHKHITSWEAIQRYRVTRLADVVFRLKEKGWLINTTMVETRDGTRFARYYLVREPKRG